MNNGILRFVKILPTLLIFILFFLATLYTPKDFDLGWHLKYGQYFVQNFQILSTNIYSTTMSNYHWYSTSWFLDPIIYLIFEKFDFIGISITGSIVTTLILLVFHQTFRLNFPLLTATTLFLFYFLDPVIDASLRGQTVSLFFLAVLLSLLRMFEKGINKALDQHFNNL